MDHLQAEHLLIEMQLMMQAQAELLAEAHQEDTAVEVHHQENQV